MKIDPKEIAKSYFKSWQERDFETFRSLLAVDATFTGPLGVANNADECVEALKRLSNIVTDIVISHMWADESDVITWFELFTNKSTQPLVVANWSHIENNKIKKIRASYDPRILIA